MAMELEFWQADGPNGEALDFARRVAAWEILGVAERYRAPHHVMLILRHTNRQPGEWIVWVAPWYKGGTQPVVGKIAHL